jgi:type II secretory pathway pseudopilin PulG
MVIIGIVASILTGFFISSLRKTQLRDGAVQLLTDMRQARSQSIRTSQASSVILASTAQASPSNTYTTAWRTSGTVSTATSTTRTLTVPIRVAPYSSANALYYSGPYGEATNAAGSSGTAASAIAGVVWEVSSTVIPDKLYVKTIGVTGKVILSASPN